MDQAGMSILFCLPSIRSCLRHSLSFRDSAMLLIKRCYLPGVAVNELADLLLSNPPAQKYYN